MHTVSPHMHTVITSLFLVDVVYSDYWLMYSNSLFHVILATRIVPVAARTTKSASFLTSTAV